MKQSIRYVQVKLVIRHEEDVDLTEVINEADYGFRNQTPGAYFENTEITDISETPWE
jgi:hypothetical protein